RIPVDVNVEDVHEDRDPRRLAVNEQRLVDVRNHQDLAVRRRNDESRTPRASPFRVAEEIRTPAGDDGDENREQPQRPRPIVQRRDERDRDRGDTDSDEGPAFASEAQVALPIESDDPVRRLYASRYRLLIAVITSGGICGPGASPFHSP